MHGLVLTETIANNVALPVMRRLATAGLLRSSARRRAWRASSAQSSTSARAGRSQIVGELSGGNQQKVVLAKSLAVDAEVLLLDEPTFGIDIGAAADLIGQVRSMTDYGPGRDLGELGPAGAPEGRRPRPAARRRRDPAVDH